jgi:hypothetical protein
VQSDLTAIHRFAGVRQRETMNPMWISASAVITGVGACKGILRAQPLLLFGSLLSFFSKHAWQSKL